MSEKISYKKLIVNGIFSENPVFKLALSLCPAVAVTTSVKNGFLMGVAVLFVMTMVNATVSLLRNFINPKVRIPSYMFIIATWVTVTDLVMAAYARKFGADTNRWLFLTGPNSAIAKLAIDSLKLTAVEKKPEERQSPEDLFIHSTISVVIDRYARLRGVFETEGEGIAPGQAQERILAAVRRLERER